MIAPSAALLTAFGAVTTPVPLAGGQGTSWRSGDVMLKPWDMSTAALTWQESVLRSVDGRADVRVAPPLRSVDDALVVAGWTAWRWEPGAHQPARWSEVVAAGRALHRALADVPEPSFLAARDDVWARADRVAWDEAPPPALPLLDRLRAAYRPVAARLQIVHGDLTGNVLFAPGLPPLAIDLSAYWRPPAWATGVVVADALVFEGAGPDVVDLLDELHGTQCLLRALAFRLVTAHLAGTGTDRFGDAVALALKL